MGNQMCCHEESTKDTQPEFKQQSQASTNQQLTSLKSLLKSIRIEMRSLEVKQTNIEKLRNFKVEQKIRFAVVWITIGDDLKASLQNVAAPELKFYRNENEANWSLHKNGFYMYRKAQLHQPRYVILNNDCYFEANLKQKTTSTPYETIDDVIYIDKDGRFDGKMKDMKAECQNGTLYKWRTKLTYSGEWMDGILRKGIISTQRFSFDGNYDEKGMPIYGEFRFIDKDTVYTGSFKNGTFNTVQKEQAIYETKFYHYKGQFKDGMKYGNGALNYYGNYDGKSSNIKKDKYISQQNFEGVWHNDKHYKSTTLFQKQFMEHVKLYILQYLGKVQVKESTPQHKKIKNKHSLIHTNSMMSSQSYVKAPQRIIITPEEQIAFKRMRSSTDQFQFYQEEPKPAKKKEPKQKAKLRSIYEVDEF